MKKYYFLWYNKLLDKYDVKFIEAENEIDAKKLAILIMRFICGNSYSVDNIIQLEELHENTFRNMQYIQAMYAEFGYPMDKIDDSEVYNYGEKDS